MRGKIPKKDWPDYLRHPVVRGVFVGGCVKRGVGSSFRAKAHAHASESDAFHGWICYRKAERLASREIALHEIGHLISGTGHDDAWRRAVLSIGGTLDAVPGLLKDYNRKPREIEAGFARIEKLDKQLAAVRRAKAVLVTAFGRFPGQKPSRFPGFPGGR